jgi:hypothetical protein
MYSGRMEYCSVSVHKVHINETQLSFIQSKFIKKDALNKKILRLGPMGKKRPPLGKTKTLKSVFYLYCSFDKNAFLSNSLKIIFNSITK